MIEDVAGIDTEFQSLGFRQLHGLLQVGIKSPGSRCCNGALSKRAAVSWKRILENDLINARILDCVQSAKRVEVLSCRHASALRVLNGLVRAGSEVVGAGGVGSRAPTDFNALGVEWSDDIRSSGGVEHVLRHKRRRNSADQIYDPA